MSCAFLGPVGSYTSQAAARLLPHITLKPFTSIQEVYNADTPYAVLPIENTIHGVVQETLGCLLSDETTGWRVTRTSDMGIQHALVVAEGTKRADVRWVASHEQVRPILHRTHVAHVSKGSRTMHSVPPLKLSQRKTRTSSINSTSSARSLPTITPISDRSR